MLEVKILVASVIIDIKHEKVNKIYDYYVQESDQMFIKKGMRVIVPFTDNDIQRLALIVDIKDDSKHANKYILSILDLEPVFSDEFFMMVDYLLENPQTIMSNAISTVIPKNLLINYQKVVSALDQTMLPLDLKPKFKKNNHWILKKSDQVFYARLKSLKDKGIIQIDTLLQMRNKAPKKEYISLEKNNYIGTPKQNEVTEYLKNKQLVLKKELYEIASPSIIKKLIDKEVIKSVRLDERLTNKGIKKAIKLDLIPNLDFNFNEALQSHQTYVLEGGFDNRLAFLNHLIKSMIDSGKQILILIPERFMVNGIKKMIETTFENELIIDLSQAQSDKELYLNQSAIKNLESHIIIGNRKSIFTDFKNLGAIYVDEYLDQAYVPFEGVYYDVLKLASIRTSYNQVPLFLADEILMLKSYKEINEGMVKHISLKTYDPKEVVLVDMKKELMLGNTKMISNELKNRMDKVLAQNEKVLLILNQKGYAPFVMCRSCSHVPSDPLTQIPLTYHEKDHMLRSNLTKYEIPFSKTCEVCKKDTVKAVGSGIEQLEIYLSKVYPTIDVLRIDSDSINNQLLYQTIEDLSDGKKIIIGTQMALKSRLTHKISLVSILMSDQWLKIPKYDAYEKSYNAFMKAKSIAKDSLVIQGYDLSNTVLQSIKNDDSMFYKHELSNRKISNLPPYYNLLQLRLEGDSYLKTFKYGAYLKQEGLKYGLDILGPTPSVLIKKAQKYRILLSIKYQHMAEEFIKNLKNNQDIDIYTYPDIIWY